MILEIKDGEYIFHGKCLSNITEKKNELLEPYGKIVLNYGIVLQLIPEKHETKINQQIGNARFVRNNYLTERKNRYNETKETLFVSDYLKYYYPLLKQDNEFLNLSDKFAIESALDNVDTAYKNFFENLKQGKKSGFPQFASKYKPNGNSYTTKYTNNNIELLEINGLPYIKLPKIGKVRFVLPKDKTLQTLKPKNTKITRATIKKDKSIYTVSLQMETVVDKPLNLIRVNARDIIAADMGLKDFAIYGNKEYTEKIENPRFIKIHEKRIRRLSQSLSRKKKGSKNYEKSKEKLAKEHRKIKNQRKDFHHKLSKKIADSCCVFICEDLNIPGMMKNHKLAKSIASVGWGQFLNFVKYKMERKGGKFIQVDRFFSSSKLCNCCGYKNTDLELKDREWICPKCGTHHDRDGNAKNNIFDEGVKFLLANNIFVIM